MPQRWTVHRSLAAAVATVTLLTVLCGLVIERTAALTTIERLDTRAENHETRLRAVEREMTEIAAHVRWIRRGLETRWQRDPHPLPEP